MRVRALGSHRGRSLAHHFVVDYAYGYGDVKAVVGHNWVGKFLAIGLLHPGIWTSPRADAQSPVTGRLPPTEGFTMVCWPGRFAAAGVVLLAWASGTPRAAERVDRYVVISSGNKVGVLTATTRGPEVEIDGRIDQNGRGQKLRERLRIGPRDVPVEWETHGTSEMGAKVDERFQVKSGRAIWKTLNDAGSAEGADGALYLPNDSTSWSLGVLARAALAAGGSVRALPSGRVQATRLRPVQVGGSQGLATTAYALSGYALSPDFVLLADDGRLVAYVADGYVLVEDRFATEYGALSAIARDLDRELLSKLAGDLSHHYPEPIYLQNVRVFDSASARLGDPATVVVYDGRVVGVRADAAPPQGATIFDGGGGALLPGLHDLLAHMWSWAGPMHLAAGVTSVRDRGNDNDTLLAFTARMDLGEIVGPAWRAPVSSRAKAPTRPVVGSWSTASGARTRTAPTASEQPCPSPERRPRQSR